MGVGDDRRRKKGSVSLRVSMGIDDDDRRVSMGGVVDDRRDSMAASAVPVGFRFSPTDIELLAHYLARKARGDPDDPRFFIPTRTDIYDTRSRGNSQSLAQAQAHSHEMYCFTALRYIGAKNSNKNFKRNTGHGTWRSTGTRRHIHDCTGAVVGSKLHLSYYAKGCTTASNWIMHEFRLPNSSKGDDLILCRIKGPSPTASAPPPPPPELELPQLLPAPPPQLYPLPDTTTMHACQGSSSYNPNDPLVDLRGINPLLDGLGLGGGLTATTATQPPPDHCSLPSLLSPQPQPQPQSQMELGEGVCEGGDEDILAGLADDIEDKLLQDNNDDEATR